MGGKHSGGKGKDQEVLGEFYGVIKAFNAEKGFGFISCDALKASHEGDVYLHQKNILDFKIGQEVKFEAYLHNRRLQGRNLVDATGMVGAQTGAMPGMGDEQELGMFLGNLKVFHEDKGFGFIVCDSLSVQGYQGDVFVHSKSKGQFNVGDNVAFMAILRNGKLQARDLEDPAEVLGPEAAAAAASGSGGGMGGGCMGGGMDKGMKGGMGGGMGGGMDMGMKGGYMDKGMKGGYMDMGMQGGFMGGGMDMGMKGGMGGGMDMGMKGGCMGGGMDMGKGGMGGGMDMGMMGMPPPKMRRMNLY